MDKPKISIVIPSLNQGKYIEQTIQSIIGQNYPNLELLICDGGSSDETIEIIKKYDSHISFWRSHKDNGQADAINEGFQHSTGEIMAWINSDDYYLPNTFNTIIKHLNKDKAQILVGNTISFYEDSVYFFGSDIVNNFNKSQLLYKDQINQPSSFWTRKTYKIIGELNIKYHYVFDWEYFLRMSLSNKIDFLKTSDYYSVYRFHVAHKTSTGGLKRENEIWDLIRNHVDKKNADHQRYLAKNNKLIRNIEYYFRKIKLPMLGNIVLIIAFPKAFLFNRNMTKRFID
jgi:glycosyltransferase involved in cell wall biosynthesis